MRNHKPYASGAEGARWTNADQDGPRPQDPGPRTQDPGPRTQDPGPRTQDRTRSDLGGARPGRDHLGIVLAVRPPLFSSALAECLRSQAWVDSVVEDAELLARPHAPDIGKVDILVLHAPGAPDTLQRAVTLTSCGRPDLRILALVGSCTDSDLAHLVAAGATGILLHCCGMAELCDAVRRVGRFEQVLPTKAGVRSSQVVDLDAMDYLTPAERKVMRMPTAGLKRCEIASALSVSGWTVDSHRKSAERKMGAKPAGG